MFGPWERPRVFVPADERRFDGNGNITGYAPEELEQLKAAYQALNKNDRQTVKDILCSLADKTNESEGECISNAKAS